MFEPDWLASNAYRVLGVTCCASPREIHEAAASLRRSNSLGLLRPLANDPADLNPPSRTEDDIRAAVGRLENPAQRLQDRLFWFSSLGADGPAPENPAGAHDAALRELIAAANAGGDDGAVGLWADALRAWNEALSSDVFWDWFDAIEIEANFEPPALPSEINALRGRAISVAGAPLVSLGNSAVASSNVALGGKVAACLDRLSATGAWATTAVSELCEPTVVDVLARCESLHKDLESSIIREAGQAARNVGPCNAVLARFRNEVSPGLDLLRSLAPTDSDALLRARDAAARCLGSIAAATTWADDYIKADQIYREASVLAEGTISAVSIADNLEEIQPSVRLQRSKGAQGQSGHSPKREESRRQDNVGRDAALTSFLELCDRVGSELEGKLKRVAGAASQNKGPCSLALKRFRTEITPALQRLLASAAEKDEIYLRAREGAARCLAAVASATTWTDDFVYAEKLYKDALVLAEGTMAVGMIGKGLKHATENANKQRFHGRAISSAPMLYTLNGVGTSLYGRSDVDPATGSYVTTLYFVILMIPILPLARYRVIQQSDRRYQFLGKQPFRTTDRWWLGLVLGGIALLILWGAIQSGSSQTYTYAGSSGGVPTAVDSTAAVSAPTAAAVAGNYGTAPVPPVPPPTFQPDNSSRVAAIDNQLSELKSQIGLTDSSISSLQSELDEMKENQSLGEDVDTNEYNSKVDEYNEFIERRRSLVAQYNDLVQEHNLLIGRP